MAGALLGHPHALRRILGARRAGRYGAGLSLAAALLAAPPRQIPWLAGIWITLAMVAWRLQPHQVTERPLRPREVLRASLWTSPPLVLLAAPLRALDASEFAVPLALAISTLLLHRNLSRASTYSPPWTATRPPQTR